MNFQSRLVYSNILLYVIFHLAAIFGLYETIFNIKPATAIFGIIISIFGSIGVQCGAHRLWCHKAYKAKLPLKIFLAFWHTFALQNDIYEWCRDHRAHHMYSDTNGDPHNSQRGFFFCHTGWLLCKKHQDIVMNSKLIDMSDLENDPIVRFQRKYYKLLVILIWGVFPTLTPCYFWNESFVAAFFSGVPYRTVLFLNFTWLINSASHMWGSKPYDKRIAPVECNIRHFLFGEGNHNYHHTFPWDYKASEFGWKITYNPATLFIDLMAHLGQAYDLRKASNTMIQQQKIKHGDVDHGESNYYLDNLYGFLSFLLILSPILYNMLSRF